MSVRQMTAQTLNALKGWPSPAAVDYEAAYSPTIPAADRPVPPGAVVHVSPTDKMFVLGVGTDPVMPLFTFHASNDPTVNASGGGDPSTDRGVYIPINPTGVGMALPAVGAYELVSTHFDKTLTGQYTVNKPLTAKKSGQPNPGMLIPGVLYTDMIVGIVSRGVVDNGYGHSSVAFWPHPVFPTP